MKHVFIVLFAFLTASLSAQNFSAMTYNIRLDVASDGENSWSYRKNAFVDQIHFFEPSVLGIQEGLPQQVKFLKKRLKGYKYIGKGRNGGKNGEFSAIFYNAHQLEVLKSDTFWLSETPEQVSVGWDAALPRICTYGKFRDKHTGSVFWVFNTHFDHLGKEARANSAQLILQKIKNLVDKHDLVFLMGDLNTAHESKPITLIEKIMKDCAEEAKITFGPETTFNGFNFGVSTSNRIDYIFVKKSKKTSIKKYAVLNNSREGGYISDHFPVFVEFQIK